MLPSGRPLSSDYNEYNSYDAYSSVSAEANVSSEEEDPSIRGGILRGHFVSEGGPTADPRIHALIQKNVLRLIEQTKKRSRGDTETEIDTSFKKLRINGEFVGGVTKMNPRKKRVPPALSFHFCPPSDSRYEQLTDKVYGANGVFCAFFDLGDGTCLQAAPFFPDKIQTSEDLEELIVLSNPICQTGNRSLCYSPSHELYFESLQNGKTSCAVPLFYVNRLVPGNWYYIFQEGEPLSSTEIWNRVLICIDRYNKIGGNNPLRYVNVPGEDGEEGLLAIDIGFCFKDQGVHSGILFIIENNVIANSVDVVNCLNDLG